MGKAVKAFTTLFIVAARPCRHRIGDRWFVEEAYVTISGRRCCLYRRPVRPVIDVPLSPGAITALQAASPSKRWRMDLDAREVTTDRAAVRLRRFRATSWSTPVTSWSPAPTPRSRLITAAQDSPASDPGTEKFRRTADVVSGHAFVPNLRRHNELFC
jgi:transposase, IS6 family